MSAADESRLADELIDAARVLWLRAKALVPRRQPVTLDVGERLSLESDQELVHVGMIEVAADELILLAGIAPPAHDLRRLQPAHNQRQIGFGQRPKRVRRRHDSLSAHDLFGKTHTLRYCRLRVALTARQRLDGDVAVGEDADV